MQTERHFWLTRGMARAIGVNLTDALASGMLDRRTYAGAVARCAQCPLPDACTTWMSEQTDRAQALPSYCRNKSVLDPLKAPGR